jgi:hypothetical protein
MASDKLRPFNANLFFKVQALVRLPEDDQCAALSVLRRD